MRTSAKPSEAKLANIQAKLAEQVEALKSTEAWNRMLEVAAKFHRYSPNNVWLIMAQCPDASQVAGYTRWHEMGRQVRKGEKGIAILAPVFARKADRDDDETARPVVGYRTAYVWDIEQTDGNPLPEIRPAQLTGEDSLGLSKQLAQLIGEHGFELRFDDLGGSKNGMTDFTDRVVTIERTLASAQAAKTLAHELGHIRADHEARLYAHEITRNDGEVEAESIAYVVLAALGADTADYSIPYVAGWSQRDAEAVQESASRVIRTAHQILESLDTAQVAEAVAA